MLCSIYGLTQISLYKNCHRDRRNKMFACSIYGLTQISLYKSCHRAIKSKSKLRRTRCSNSSGIKQEICRKTQNRYLYMIVQSFDLVYTLQ